MRSSAPASAAVATPWRRCPLPTKWHAVRQSGNAVRLFSYAARFLILGTSSGAPNWHQPRQSSPSNTRAACAVPVRTRASFRSRLGGTAPLLSSWNPMHQQPPKIPLLRSTSVANAGQVDSSKALTMYADTTMEKVASRSADAVAAGTRLGRASPSPATARSETFGPLVGHGTRPSLSPERRNPRVSRGFLGMGGTGLEPVTPSLSSWCSPN